MNTEQRKPCVACGSTGRPIVYGLPTISLFEAAERGEVELGGCCPPQWPTCGRCGAFSRTRFVQVHRMLDLAYVSHGEDVAEERSAESPGRHAAY